MVFEGVPVHACEGWRYGSVEGCPFDAHVAAALTNSKVLINNKGVFTASRA